MITICTSASFYKQAVEVEEKLQKLGFGVIIPETARKMKASGDYEVEHYKTWFADPNDYHKKSRLMREHFKEIEKGDSVLVLNYEKHGKQNYIGGNVLMEMALAFWLNKPIYILNEIPEDSPFVEEIKGFEPTVLNGELGKIKS
ncbi:hypothetical protein KDA00_00790 [Candidatus Saccharibacteria bacterium]|nr:hypothetical protein [Candidatus Saccharibacteria bacterium]